MVRNGVSTEDGYATTSHAAQGKTVDLVFIAQGAASQGAASREQSFLSASRCVGRGRDTSYPVPPAQIPAGGTTAPGSYLEF